MKDAYHTYWLDTPLIQGEPSSPSEGQIVIIGSGIAGASAAYWLQEYGFKDLIIVDFELEKAASFRNCGHVLHGSFESMQALVTIHGEDLARKVWQFSVDICEDVRTTIAKLRLEADYRQDGYLVIAIDENEKQEIKESIALLNKFGFQSEYRSSEQLHKLGFRHVYGARFEPGSAQVHPTKLRNGLIHKVCQRGGRYYSKVQVKSVEEQNGRVCLETKEGKHLYYDAAVIATNAYSPLLSRFFSDHRLVEPFRGQIITSQRLKKPLPVSYPHSFDHGYEYALATADNRLMLGGWRNHTANGEVGTYDLTPNPEVVEGLRKFAQNHYHLQETLRWDYSWAGIMASSKTGFPFIGPTDSPMIFTVSGFTGHGLSWAHGSAKVLAKIIAGEDLPEITPLFNPVMR